MASGQMQDAFAKFRHVRKATTAMSSPILDANDSLTHSVTGITSGNAGRNISPICSIAHRLFHQRSYSSQRPRQLMTQCSAVPTEEEVEEALSKLKSGKALRICNIAPEMLKAGSPFTVRWLTNLFQAIWEKAQYQVTGRKMSF